MLSGALAAIGLATSLLLAPNAAPVDIAPPGQVTVDLVTINGSGCPPGSTAVAVAPDNTAFTVTYSKYLAQAGGSASAIERRKNCQLALDFHVPSGYTFAISRSDLRGYGYLQKGASAVEKSSYYFQGSAVTSSAAHTITGPMDDNWQTSDVAPLVFAPCDAPRYLNLNTELRVNVGSDPAATSFLTMDSADGSLGSVYHFAWNKC